MSDSTTVFVPPFTITAVSTQGGVAYPTYVDANNVTVPPGLSPIPVTQGCTAAGFTFTRQTALRLVGGAVKTIGNDPTMMNYNFLDATTTGSGSSTKDTVTVPWDAGVESTRGLVLLFAQTDAQGNMLGFVPTTDPTIKNNGV
ncbi:hypothetical protein H5407_22980 [Mitsuaria sp. WAJ17]|uniref:hypothetical protein n=1 Tax=Mitsuaria sp. WAJ17 TaxID=2761452 RepID=UPI001603E2B0|nr:hypothetical protein [Mitsuaria sp. WAJ17]MBB2488102.1 hypothetical protein [Mitsuaria sp. WAJ17]